MVLRSEQKELGGECGLLIQMSKNIEDSLSDKLHNELTKVYR